MDRSFLTALALLLGLTGPGQAAKVKVWHQHRPSHFAKAKLHHAVVSNEGTLRLSRVLSPLAGIEATHVWDVLEDSRGNLFVATGGAGKIYRVGPDGKARLLHTSEDSQVLCLA